MFAFRLALRGVALIGHLPITVVAQVHEAVSERILDVLSLFLLIHLVLIHLVGVLGREYTPQIK